VGNQLVGMLQSSAAPFNLNGADGRIYVIKIRAGESLLDPEPYIPQPGDGRHAGRTERDHGQRGGYARRIAEPALRTSAVQGGEQHSDISEVTIVEVFYLYRTITPLPEFIENLILPDRGGILIGSRATF
jgi:hypothetical protein